MNFESCRNSIESYLNTQWLASSWSAIPIIWDNTIDDVDGSKLKPFIFDGESEQTSLGAQGCHRRYGILIIQVFIPINTGTDVIEKYCDTLTNMFKAVNLGDAHFMSPTAVRVGNVDKVYFQKNVQAPFYVDIH